MTNFELSSDTIRLPYMGGMRQSTFAPRLCDVIQNGWDIGLTDYPIWDEGYRVDLNKKITDHFWFREFAAESTTMFIFFLNRTMREQMPRINPLFVAIENFVLANEFEVRDENTGSTGGVTVTSAAGITTRNDSVSEDNEGSSHGTDESHAAVEQGSKATHATTPQMNLQEEAMDRFIDSGTFQDSSSTTSTDSSNDGTTSSSTVRVGAEMGGEQSSSMTQSGGSNSGTSTSGGRHRSLTELMAQWRDDFTNPYQVLFDALEPCFSQLWIDHMNV